MTVRSTWGKLNASVVVVVMFLVKNCLAVVARCDWWQLSGVCGLAASNNDTCGVAVVGNEGRGICGLCLCDIYEALLKRRKS